jgi:hypothetical protein
LDLYKRQTRSPAIGGNGLACNRQSYSHAKKAEREAEAVNIAIQKIYDEKNIGYSKGQTLIMDALHNGWFNSILNQGPLARKAFWDDVEGRAKASSAGEKALAEIAKARSETRAIEHIRADEEWNESHKNDSDFATTKRPITGLEQQRLIDYDTTSARKKSEQQDAIKKTAEASAASRPLEDIDADIKAGRKGSAAEWMAVKNAEKLTYETELTRQNEISAEYTNYFNEFGKQFLQGMGINGT